MLLRRRPGQALVVILLMLAVATTIGLAIVSRSVTEVGVSTTQEESARALAAAEAGIESSLASIVANGTYNVGTTGATYTVTSVPFGSGGEFAISRPLLAGDSETIFLSGHDANGNLVPGQDKYADNNIRICWGQNVNAGDAAAPALEVIFYFQTPAGTVKVGREGYDPNASRRGQNNFIAPTGGAGCPSAKTYAFSTQVALNNLNSYNRATDNPLLLRLRLLYNGEVGHYAGVTAQGGAALPVQGNNITSAGQAGNSTRKVQLFQKYNDPFPQFDNAVFSGGSLTK